MDAVCSVDFNIVIFRLKTIMANVETKVDTINAKRISKRLNRLFSIFSLQEILGKNIIPFTNIYICSVQSYNNINFKINRLIL